MSKHTAGPWKSLANPGTGNWQGSDKIGIESPTWVVADVCADIESIEEAQANARLIAEAPPMLALLQEADRLYSTYGLTATGGLEVGAWINNVRDCIARVEGATPMTTGSGGVDVLADIGEKAVDFLNARAARMHARYERNRVAGYFKDEFGGDAAHSEDSEHPSGLSEEFIAATRDEQAAYKAAISDEASARGKLFCAVRKFNAGRKP